TINTCNLRPRSVGQVTLQSADPTADPLIDPNYLDDPHDWKMSMEAFQLGRELLATQAFGPVVKSEHMPGRGVQTEAQIKHYIRQWSKTDYHPVGTCKMGVDEMAVVDPDLKLHGMAGLRVVD